MRGAGDRGKDDRVGGGDEGVKDENTGVVRRMSEKKVSKPMLAIGGGKLTFKLDIAVNKPNAVHPSDSLTQLAPYSSQNRFSCRLKKLR